eukprot:5788650-Amphidinium_carterae.1
MQTTLTDLPLWRCFVLKELSPNQVVLRICMVEEAHARPFDKSTLNFSYVTIVLEMQKIDVARKFGGPAETSRTAAILHSRVDAV